jgi:endo-1,4-beta-mannosidase
VPGRGPDKLRPTISRGASWLRLFGGIIIAATFLPAVGDMRGTGRTGPDRSPSVSSRMHATDRGKGRFVAACGESFCIAGERWRMHGASVFNGLRHPHKTVRRARNARLNTLRIVNFLDEEGPPRSAFDEKNWMRVDRLIAAAARADVRVILDLSTYRNMLVNAGRNPYTTDWGPFVRFVTQRRNRVTGTRYAADPTIALVALAGEVEPPVTTRATGDQVTRFFRRTFRQWAAADPNHLLSSGGLLHLDWRSGLDWRSIFSLRNSHVCSIHAYSPGDFKTSLRRVDSYCDRLDKPWILEEFGWRRAIGDRERARRFARTYRSLMRRDAAGGAFWNLGGERDSGTFDVNRSTLATFRAVRRAAPADA